MVKTNYSEIEIIKNMLYQYAMYGGSKYLNNVNKIKKGLAEKVDWTLLNCDMIRQKNMWNSVKYNGIYTKGKKILWNWK